MLFRDLLRLLSGERPRLGWWVVLVLFSVFLLGVELLSSLAVLTMMRLLLDGDPGAALALAVLGPTSLESIERERLQLLLAVGLLGLFALRAVLMTLVSYLGARLSTTASVRIARRLLAGYLQLPYVQHTQRRSSDMVRDTFVSTERLYERATRPLAALATDVIMTVGLVVALLLVDPIVTLIAGGLLTGATLAVQKTVQPRLRRWSREAQQATSASLEFSLFLPPGRAHSVDALHSHSLNQRADFG